MTVTSKSLPAVLSSATYAFRGGFLVRPFIIALALGAAGAGFSWWEEEVPAIGSLVPGVLFPSQADPQVAQAILTDIATSIMTVVSIVFAILLMTLTLASTQFSPRILISFIRDRVTQWTLGIFLGTFSYCIAALPAARSAPHAFVPVATVTGAMLLAPVCVGWLIYFIHHISNAISVNHIVDRIARETELVIDELMPEPRRPVLELPPPGVVREGLELVIASRRSGYIRFIDIPRLRSLALAYRVCLRVQRRVGHFVPEGVALLHVSRGDRVTPQRDRKAGQPDNQIVDEDRRHQHRDKALAAGIFVPPPRSRRRISSTSSSRSAEGRNAGFRRCGRPVTTSRKDDPANRRTVTYLDERDARTKRLDFQQPRPRPKWRPRDLSGAAQAAF